MLLPRIADIRCSRIHFEPGDRLLVKVRSPLEPEARRRLHQSIQKWTGDGVEILIIDSTKMEISIEKRLQIGGTGL